MTIRERTESRQASLGGIFMLVFLEVFMSRSSWLLLAVSLAFLGCNSEGAKLSTIPVTGTVTLDGKPVPGAAVAFSPTDAKGRAASGLTDIDGKFKLTTMTSGDGALAGSYKVAITKNVGGDSGPKEDPRNSGKKMTPEETKAMMEAVMKGKVVEGKSEVPEKYTKADTSGLTAEVKSGENNFTFEMKSN
jgi:hypothetical protein